MRENTPDFSDLDDTDLEASPATEQPASFLDAQAEAAKRISQQTCYACKGTGRFCSKFTGRIVGECFSCKGTGKVSARAAKSHATKQANVRTRTEQKAQWLVEHKDVIDWVTARSARSSFATSLLTRLETGPLTEGQVNAVRRIITEEAARAADAVRAANTDPRNQSGLDLSHIPAGRYAVPHGETRLKVLIKRPTTSPRWAGYTFVSDAAEYGQQRKYGMQAPGYRYKGAIEAELIEIAKDPKAAAIAYGRLTGTCCICGRKLEDAESVANGIGPICAGKFA